MPTPDFPTGEAILCISVSARPGRFGSTVHTAGYRALGLNYVYLARPALEIAPVIAAVRALGIRGCSVSMPFKTEVIAHLDALDPLASTVGAVNTVVNEAGRLTGYNTDVGGVVGALQAVSQPLKSAVILGAGGMSRAAVTALIRLGVSDIVVAARHRGRSLSVVGSLSGNVIEWSDRTHVNADLLINATSVGMAPGLGDTPMPETALDHFRVVTDAVSSPLETRLLADARQRSCVVVNGVTIAFHQALLQFRHYTGCEPPVEAMRLAAEQCTGGKL